MPEGVTSSNILQPFNIPTTVGGGPPMQKAPNLGLTFPVFTPPAASSYGTTNPMPIPWTPPDLAGAINRGIETGAHLATDAIANKKSLTQIATEEQARKIAIQRAADPNAAYYTTTELGPAGATVRQLSPAEMALQQSQIAQRQAEIEATRSRVAIEQQKTPAEIARETAEAARAAAEAREHGISGFNQGIGRGSGSASGSNVNTTSNVNLGSGYYNINYGNL